MNTVSAYTVQGFNKYLPPLITGRASHACSGYSSGDRKVRLYVGEKRRKENNYLAAKTQTNQQALSVCLSVLVWPG